MSFKIVLVFPDRKYARIWLVFLNKRWENTVLKFRFSFFLSFLFFFLRSTFDFFSQVYEIHQVNLSCRKSSSFVPDAGCFVAQSAPWPRNLLSWSTAVRTQCRTRISRGSSPVRFDVFELSTKRSKSSTEVRLLYRYASIMGIMRRAPV